MHVWKDCYLSERLLCFGSRRFSSILQDFHAIKLISVLLEVIPLWFLRFKVVFSHLLLTSNLESLMQWSKELARRLISVLSLILWWPFELLSLQDRVIVNHLLLISGLESLKHMFETLATIKKPLLPQQAFKRYFERLLCRLLSFSGRGSIVKHGNKRVITLSQKPVQYRGLWSR